MVIIAPDEAAVTGFSGAPAPPEIAPGDDPASSTFIDLKGPSLRIVDLRRMEGPAKAQLVGAPKPFTVPASEIGQAFGVAIDDASPPNVYVAASSAYGLPIVAPGPGGAPRHVRSGVANAAFMSGLWGAGGGPGSIWKIDGATARVSLFANVTTDGRVNSGAALGGLAFDPRTRSLFVADRETGLVHRIGLDGADRGTYDHGVTGRSAQGLLPVPWNGRPPLDVTNPKFDSGDPATWNLAAPERRVFALAVHDGRLLYAVADSLQIWSVGLTPDGGFGADAVIELQAPPSAGQTEISKIVFDAQGRMLLAERAAPTGAFDFEALAAPGVGRVLRYGVVGTAAGRRVWQDKPDEYALGFPGDYRNGDGGVDVGDNYGPSGEVLGDCGGFVWMSGEDLRQSPDATLAAQLARSGPLPVDGLQGVGAWRDRPRNAPPLQSYFVSYADGPLDESARGRMGDIAILRTCGASGFASPPANAPPAPPVPTPAAPGSPPLPPPHVNIPPSPPPGSCQPNEVRRVSTGACAPACGPGDVQIGRRCCPVATLAANAECSNSACTPGQTAIGPSNSCCDASHVYTNTSGAPACCVGSIVNGTCMPVNPPVCPPGGPVTSQCPCPGGYVQSAGACCLVSQTTSTGVCCPLGTAPGGPNRNLCAPILHIPIGQQCCVTGKIPTASGACCLPGNVTTTGVCCSAPVDSSHPDVCPAQAPSVPTCAAGYAMMPDGSCCNSRFVGAGGRVCLTAKPPCGRGEVRNAEGVCEKVAPPVVIVPPRVVAPTACPAGEARNRDGRCSAPTHAVCPPGRIRGPDGICAPFKPAPCPEGEARSRDHKCVPLSPGPRCPPDMARDAEGVCVPFGAAACPPGLVRNPRGVCVLPPCPPGAVRTPRGFCVPLGAPGFAPRGPALFGPPRGPGFSGPGGGGQRLP
jgi:hypothetical protein